MHAISVAVAASNQKATTATEAATAANIHIIMMTCSPQSNYQFRTVDRPFFGGGRRAATGPLAAAYRWSWVGRETAHSIECIILLGPRTTEGRVATLLQNKSSGAPHICRQRRPNLQRGVSVKWHSRPHLFNVSDLNDEIIVCVSISYYETRFASSLEEAAR